MATNWLSLLTLTLALGCAESVSSAEGIDVDGDGACDPMSDRSYASYSAFADSDLLVRASGQFESNEFFPQNAPESCELFNAAWPVE